MNCRCLVICSVLLTAAAPLWADPAAAPAPTVTVPQSVLDGLTGKRSILGFTVRGGRKFLGRVLSGDHGLYIVQTFHYTSAPATTTETTQETIAVAGRRGRLRPQTKEVKTQVTTQKTLADAVAVQALLSGVAGPAFTPNEQPAQREMIAPADVLCLQRLSPPAMTGADVTKTDAAKTASANWTLKTLWASPSLADGTRAK